MAQERVGEKPVHVDSEERKRFIEPRVYRPNNSVNVAASIIVSLLRKTLNEQSGSTTFSLYFNKPPYFETRPLEHDFGFESDISFILEGEERGVSLHQERVEVHYSPEEVEGHGELVRALENGTVVSIRFKIDADKSEDLYGISESPHTRGIVIGKAEVLGWMDKVLGWQSRREEGSSS